MLICRPEPGLTYGRDLGLLLGGHLFVTGRLKDLIIIRGTTISPTISNPRPKGATPPSGEVVAPAFCVDHPDGEELVVICELGRGHEESIREAVTSIRRAIVEEHELRTHAVVLVRPGAVPKTPSGKTQRLLCRSGKLSGGPVLRSSGNRV